MGSRAELWLCTSNATPPVANWGACSGGGTDEQRLIDLQNTNIINVVNPSGTGLFEYVEITIPAIYNRAVAAHPITNPTYTLTSQVRPPGHSG
jgi:hypothetical protein